MKGELRVSMESTKTENKAISSNPLEDTNIDFLNAGTNG